MGFPEGGVFATPSPRISLASGARPLGRRLVRTPSQCAADGDSRRVLHEDDTGPGQETLHDRLGIGGEGARGDRPRLPDRRETMDEASRPKMRGGVQEGPVSGRPAGRFRPDTQRGENVSPLPLARGKAGMGNQDKISLALQASGSHRPAHGSDLGMSPHLKERIAAKGGHRATIGNRPALFAAILLLFPAIALSQSIKRTVVDEGTRRPLGLVNVILKRLPDSTLVTGAATDTNGIFLLSKIPRGTYVLQLALIGYESKQLPAFAVDSAAPERDMGTISLHETPVSLEAVEVTAEKALMNLEADRKIYNVDQDILGKSASASEVLRNIPSVEVDVDGNVSLRGSSSVLLMMNGKTTPLLRTNAGEALQQIPANSIERIEVITNPSAKYTPEGASGIINLVLKRKTDEGLKGSLGLNAGMDDRYNGNLRLAYGDGGLNLFLNYSPRKNNRNRNDADVRTQIGGPPSERKSGA